MQEKPNSFIQKVRNGCCPICNKDKIFSTDGNVFLLKPPVMNKRCSNCDHQYNEEPGFFYGAMYISYFLGTFQMITVFLLSYFFLSKDVIFNIGLVSIVLLLLSFFNFRLSRIIWILIFSSKKSSSL